MSSIQSPIPFDTNPSPQSLANNNDSDSSSEKDEICNVCHQWCTDIQDLTVNFISCNTCVNSYHKRCIPIIYHTEDESYNCHEMKNKKTNEPLKCSSMNKKPSLLYDIIGHKFDKTNYIIDSNDNAIDYNPNDDSIKHQLFINNKNENNEIFSRHKCNGVTYKGIDYQIGESIEVKSDPDEPFHTKVAIIKEIYVYDEPNTLPSFCIFWYWREKEVNNYLSRKYGQNNHNKHNKLLQIKNSSFGHSESKYINNHLFIDIENEQTISIASVLHKVIICDNVNTFNEMKDLKYKEFGNVFYCNCSFTIENYTKYKTSPFEDIDMKKIKNKLKVLSQSCQKNYNKHKNKNKNMISKTEKNKNRNQESIEKVSKYLQYFRGNYKGEDSLQCMDKNIPFNLSDKQNKMDKKLPLQNGNKLTIDEINNYEQIITHNTSHNNNNENSNNIMNQNVHVPRSFSKTKKNIKKKKIISNINNVKCKTKMKLKCQKKAKMRNKDILARNKKQITVSDQNKMKSICNTLGISKGMKIDITLYGFTTHLAVYKQLLNYVKINNENNRNNKIKDLNGQKLRDIKSKIKSEGKIGRRQEMIDGICKKLSEFKIYYENNNNNKKEKSQSLESIDDDIDMNELMVSTPNKRKRPRFDFHNNDNDNNNKKRRKIDRNQIYQTNHN